MIRTDTHTIRTDRSLASRTASSQLRIAPRSLRTDPYVARIVWSYVRYISSLLASSTSFYFKSQKIKWELCFFFLSTARAALPLLILPTFEKKWQITLFRLTKSSSKAWTVSSHSTRILNILVVVHTRIFMMMIGSVWIMRAQIGRRCGTWFSIHLLDSPLLVASFCSRGRRIIYAFTISLRRK